MKPGTLLLICIILIAFLIIVANTPLREWFIISKRALIPYTKNNVNYNSACTYPHVYMPRYSVKKLKVKKSNDNSKKCSSGLCDPSEYLVIPESSDHVCSSY